MLIWMRAYFLGGILAAAFVTPALAAVNLQCDGTVTAGGKSMPSEGHVRLETDGAEGRVRLPGALLPPTRTADAANGWRPLQQIDLADGSLSAEVGLSILDRPQLTLDRQTGDLQLAGFGGSAFAGRCVDIASAEAQ
jgi:hypothetical protein